MNQPEQPPALPASVDPPASDSQKPASTLAWGSLSPRIALTALLVLAVFYTLYFARAILLPVVLAMLLALVLSPVVKALARMHIPAPLGAAAVVLAVLLGIGYGVVRLAEPAAQWIERAPATLGELEGKLRKLKKSVEGVSKAAQKVEEITTVDAQAKQKQQKVQVATPSLAGRLLSGTQAFLASAATTIVLLYFLLAAGELFLLKTVQLMPTLTDKKRAVAMVRAIESDMVRYLSTATCINAGLGAATGIAMYLLGMPNPVLWGVMVALLNYVPFLGPFVGLVILTMVALLTFDTVGDAMLVPAVFSVMVIIEGQILTPYILGRNLTLHPVTVFLAMLLWGWLWGVVGALMAVPILMTFKIACTHVPSLAPLGEFLSARRGETEPETPAESKTA
jgi:predicted PurR-regulated permease PerM